MMFSSGRQQVEDPLGYCIHDTLFDPKSRLTSEGDTPASSLEESSLALLVRQ